MEPIPVLTLWQPHASLCFLINPATGLPWKGIETRGWSTTYRGPLALAAAAKPVTKITAIGDFEAWPADRPGHVHRNHPTERPCRLYYNAGGLM